jgi:hypothetical protein
MHGTLFYKHRIPVVRSYTSNNSSCSRVSIGYQVLSFSLYMKVPSLTVAYKTPLCWMTLTPKEVWTSYSISKSLTPTLYGVCGECVALCQFCLLKAFMTIITIFFGS